MMDHPLILLLLLPAVGAFILALLPSGRLGLIRNTAIGVAAVTLAYAVSLTQQIDFSNPAIQLATSVVWNPKRGHVVFLRRGVG
jgi:NADH:ubiquinone oxidoreductase subunit 4 (chain M)